MNLSFGLVKTAADEQADRLLAREARWLRELEEVRELEGQVPRVLEEGMSPLGRRYLVISMLPAGGETRAFTGDHARFLASLRKARLRTVEFEVSGTCQWLQRSIDQARDFASPRAAQTLEESYRDCETALLYWTGPYVLSQGDFAPWNIRNLGSQLFVTDWGRAHADASPLDDVLHYLMIQRALNSRPVTVPVLRQAMRRAADFAVQAYPEWSWRPPVIGALTLVYLLGVVLERSLALRRIERAERVVGAYWKLLEKRTAWMPK
ncbi:MAG TPA: phosphotransferase [Burkholderiales bacterium]|nr:phosphotransferase [Burkholderiales bacterium]